MEPVGNVGALGQSSLEATDDRCDVYGDGVVGLWQTPGHSPGHRSIEVTVAEGRLIPPRHRCGVH